MLNKLFLCGLLLAAITAPPVFCASLAHAQPVTVFVPSQPSVEIQTNNSGGKEKAGQPKPAEVDVLMSLMLPFENSGLDMDMPRSFASLLFRPGEDGKIAETVRKDLLGDVEEIRYLDKKAWGANVALEEPGLYQFLLDARPWWDGARNMFREQQAKVILPVWGVGAGWDQPTGISFEILPSTRPFGLTAPAIFSGTVMRDGKPLGNAPVFFGRINTDKTTAPTNWHKTLEARTDAGGHFTIMLNQPGWWYCEAVTSADPLKGPDGQPREVERSTILWLYVDGNTSDKNRR